MTKYYIYFNIISIRISVHIHVFANIYVYIYIYILCIYIYDYSQNTNRYRRVLPVGLAHALSLSTGNAIYLLLNVGFIQMLKSFTPVIVMVFLYLAGKCTYTYTCIYMCVHLYVNVCIRVFVCTYVLYNLRSLIHFFTYTRIFVA